MSFYGLYKEYVSTPEFPYRLDDVSMMFEIIMEAKEAYITDFYMEDMKDDIVYMRLRNYSFPLSRKRYRTQRYAFEIRWVVIEEMYFEIMDTMERIVRSRRLNYTKRLI